MADEKILKDEILNDNELDEVAGGTGSEIRDDKKRFERLGIRITSGAHDEAQLKDAFARFGVSVETYHGDWTNNKYRIDGHSVSRDKAWQYVYSQVYYQN